MGVSENGGTPKSSILIGISIINRPFWGPPIFGNPHIPLPSQDELDIHVALNAQANGQLLNISMGQGQDWKASRGRMWELNC